MTDGKLTGRQCLAATCLLMITIVGLALAGGAAATHVYKWVDEKGVTHFSERPPPGGQGVEEVEIREPNTLQPQRQRPISEASGESHQEGELMRMPESVRTEFLRTTAGWTVEHTKKHGSVALSQTLHVEVMPSVPLGALLEVRFENPRGGIADVVEVQRPAEERTLMVASPTRTGVQCRIYTIEVRLYEDRSKSDLLSIHRQGNLSVVDTRGLDSWADYFDAMRKAATSGRCQSRESVEITARKRARPMSLATYNRIDEGMSESDLIKIAGPPHEIKVLAHRIRGEHPRFDKLFIYRGTAYNNFVSTFGIFNGIVIEKHRDP